MKTYPSIPGLSPKLHSKIEKEDSLVYLFRKEDGSNIRTEWSPKAGFYKFGRRNGLLDDSNPVLKEAPELFLNKYGDELDARLRMISKQKEFTATIYMEFFGPGSRFGNHVAEPHDVMVFDISLYKKGFMDPYEFMMFMKGWQGKHGPIWTSEMESVPLDKIRDGSLPGLPFEGVVGKTLNGDVFKYKCQRWYDALKEHCGGNQKMFEMLK